MRRAIVTLAVPFAADALNLMDDHGLNVVCSLACDNGMRLLIEGDSLPAECEDDYDKPLHEVNLIAKTEAYGSQSLTRITLISVAEDGKVARGVLNLDAYLQGAW